ncbi:hypothetical protein C8R42DRAFT_727860 [Lentinula raphanica]|nr:hypothetical protein C8R42DRAFT_727860 [Lentinula raphanica]
MDNQQWYNYMTSPPHSDLQEPPSLDLSMDNRLPTGNLEMIELDRAVSNTYGNPGVERSFGWMSLDENLNEAFSNVELTENMSEERLIVIELYLAMAADADIAPGLLFKVKLQAKTGTVTATNGILEISVRSIVTLTNSVYLPSDLKDSLNNVETLLATARSLPQMDHPPRSLQDFRLLAPIAEISMSPASQFRLQSIAENDSLHFVSVRKSEKPRFVLILQQPTNLASALQSEHQPSNLNEVRYTDVPSDASASASSVPRSFPVHENAWNAAKVPFESQMNPRLPFSTMLETVDSPNVHSQVTPQVWPQSFDTQTNEALPQPAPTASSDHRIAIHATNIRHACELLGIREPQIGPTADHSNLKRSITENLQEWFIVWKLILGLGYNKRKGELTVQRYQWMDGTVETYAEILRRINWTTKDFKTKSSLYCWAINATSTKVWNPTLPIPVGKERVFAEARQTWDRLTYFFHSTTFLHFGDPELWPCHSQEFDLTYLYHNDVQKHRRYIKNMLMTRPESSA